MQNYRTTQPYITLLHQRLYYNLIHSYKSFADKVATTHHVSKAFFHLLQKFFYLIVTISSHSPGSI